MNEVIEFVDGIRPNDVAQEVKETFLAGLPRECPAMVQKWQLAAYVDLCTQEFELYDNDAAFANAVWRDWRACEGRAGRAGE